VKTYRILLAAFFILIALASCNVTVTGFLVPSQVWAGQVFEIQIHGDGNSSGSGSGSAGAVLQLPNGFVVEAADAHHGTGPGLLNRPIRNGGTRNDANLLATMTAEPGHHLVSFHWFDYPQWPPAVALRVYVRAPQASFGTFTLKVVAAGRDGNGNGPFQVTSPAGVSSFASLTGAQWAQTCTVVSAPTAPFLIEAAGLIGTGTVGGVGSGVAFGDINGDGYDDVVFPTWQGAQVGATIWQSNPGSAWIQQSFQASGHSLSTVFADFDADGNLDSVDDSGAVRFGDGGSNWLTVQTLPVSGVGVVTTGDVDGDGLADIAYASNSSPTALVYRNLGNRTFVSWSGNLPSGSGPAGVDRSRVALRDVTRDGLCDLLTLYSAQGTSGLQVWAGDGQGNWTALPMLVGVTAFATGDFDGDGLVDIVASVPNALALLRFVNGAFSTTNLPLPAGTPPTAKDLLLVDYDRDGFEDVAFAGVGSFGAVSPPPAASRVLLLPNQGGAALGPILQLMSTVPGMNVGYGCHGLATGDIDGDGWPDLAAVMPGEQPRVWRNAGGGSVPFGNACSAINHQAPLHDTVGQPQLGSANFAFRLRNAAPQSFVLQWVGFSRRVHAGGAVLPLDLTPFGAPGCAIFASNEWLMFTLADSAGAALLPMQIPNLPALHLVTLYGQGAVLAPGANALGVLFANAVAVRLP
jgi:hypothetical protein